MCGVVKVKMRATGKFEVQLLQMELRQPATGLASFRLTLPLPDFHMRINIQVLYRWTEHFQWAY